MKRAIWQIIAITFIACTTSCSSPRIGTSATMKLVQYGIQDVDSLLQKGNKPLAIFLHADWCQYCKNMEQTTFRNPDIIKSLNEDYYFISFNGEYRDDVIINNRTYHYQPMSRNSGVHELASMLGNIDGTLTYPTFVIVNSEMENIFQYNAFLKAEEMNQVLRSNS